MSFYTIAGFRIASSYKLKLNKSTLYHYYQELIIVVREGIQRSIGMCKMSV